ncbi:glyoxalase [Serinibacter arcticus]|uniref:Glyoxalase n=1 Tax=Serinibacter arcticus TaxID=1655435 RepID=A0A2U1ZWH8_9MICO|nr:VOC family protein [Serinibacter arcticus]PWD51346.1 glyoxalase [Serinibacter arcticus]
MALRWYSTVIESTRPRELAAWWREALGWDEVYAARDEVVLVPPWARELSEQLPFHRVPPGLVFVLVEHEKTSKDRLHLDFAPHTGDDRDAEIARLEELGATRVDVGQGDDVTWTVLADIDGNEFCVLSSREM